MTHDLITGAANRLERRQPLATPIRRAPSVSYEFFPPATEAGFDTLIESARALAPFGPSFVSVTYGAGGSTQDKTFAAIDALAAEPDLDVAGHLTCVAASKQRVHEVIDRFSYSGVSRIVALRGDAPENASGCAPDGTHPDGYANAAELIEGIRNRPDGDRFDLSVGAYPEIHPLAASPAADLDNLKRKFDAGADRAITQFFFEAETFARFLEHAHDAGIDQPIVPGIMPITNFAGVCRFAERCGTTVPEWMHELFAGLDDAPEVRELVAATLAAELCKKLMEYGVTDFHFYTMNRPNLTAATCRILGISPQHRSARSQRSDTAASAAS